MMVVQHMPGESEIELPDKAPIVRELKIPDQAKAAQSRRELSLITCEPRQEKHKTGASMFHSLLPCHRCIQISDCCAALL